MIISRLTCTDIDLVTLCAKRRIYRLTTDGSIKLYTDCGVLRISWTAGAFVDGRSGGRYVDWLMPNVGSHKERTCWLAHDILFYDFGISFETTNNIFKQLLKMCGYSKLRIYLLYLGVSSDIARRHFGNNTPKEVINKTHFNVRWTDR